MRYALEVAKFQLPYNGVKNLLNQNEEQMEFNRNGRPKYFIQDLPRGLNGTAEEKIVFVRGRAEHFHLLQRIYESITNESQVAEK